jgi:hypothetical protein
VPAVELVHRLGHAAGEEPGADSRLGEHEPHRAAGAVESGGELGADEAAPEHDDLGVGFRERAKLPVVGETAEVDDLAAGVAGQPPRRPAGREQELLVAVRLAARVGDRVGASIEGYDTTSQRELHA